MERRGLETVSQLVFRPVGAPLSPNFYPRLAGLLRNSTVRSGLESFLPLFPALKALGSTMTPLRGWILGTPGLHRKRQTYCLLILELLMRLRQRGLLGAAHLGILQVHRLQRIYHRVRDHQPCEPLVICRHDVPGSIFARGVPDHIFVGFLTSFPEQNP